jgi:hypothetical protein
VRLKSHAPLDRVDAEALAQAIDRGLSRRPPGARRIDKIRGIGALRAAET